MAQGRFIAALAVSLLMHGMVMSSPGWKLADEEERPSALEARLLPPPSAPVAKTVFPASEPPQPRKKKPRRPRPARPEAARETNAASLPPIAEAAPRETAEAPAGTTETAPPVEAMASAASSETGGDAGSPEPGPWPGAAEADAPKPEALASSGRIRYVVTRGEGGLIIGQAIHTWRSDGTRYVIESTMETVGLAALLRPTEIRQVSEGTIGNAGLVPDNYRQERNGQVAEKAHFDWSRKTVSYGSGGDKLREATLAEGAQDILSQMYQSGLKAGAGGSIEMMITTGKKYDRYAYQVMAEEPLNMPFGELRTLHLRAPDPSGGQVTELWLALDYRNLPVRLRFRDRSGEVYDQTAEQLEYDGVKLPPQ